MTASTAMSLRRRAARRSHAVRVTETVEEKVDFDALDDSPDDSIDQDRALALAKAAFVLLRVDPVNAERLLGDLVSALERRSADNVGTLRRRSPRA
jgi:hypothetical protein